MSAQLENVSCCKHFVVRKKRFCRMTVKQGKEYCGEHEPCTGKEESNNTLRIVCPLDNKHTCYAHKLEKHLKICNARQKESLSYIQRNVNCNDEEISSDLTFVNHRLLSNVPVAYIKKVINKINQTYEKIISDDNIKENFMKHDIVEEELNKPEYGERTKKHLIQTSSILGNLQKHQLIQNDSCFVEFGAGKGQLSYWMSKSIEKNSNSSVLLIERAAHRHKLDNKLDKSDGRVHRIRADIADLVLQEVDVIKSCKSVVGITKHLCGDATDLALRCLVKCNEITKNVAGLVMAFCCHHRCIWSKYVGKQFFNESNLTDKDFDVMCGMVSWATCGSGLGRDKKAEDSDDGKQSNRDFQIGLSRSEKELVGFKCKYIFNFGRLKYLEQNRFSCELFYYVKPIVSPENLCIAAVKKT